MTGRIVAALALALGIFNHAAAQTDTARVSPYGWTVLGILSLPTGNYADDEKGLAKVGFGVGAEYMRPLQAPNLGLVLGGYFIRNGMDYGFIEDDFDVSVDGGGYNNFSVMGGVRLSDLAGIPGLYTQAMLGLNFVSVGDIEFDGNGSKVTQTWSSESDLALSIGVGRRFGKFDVGVRYLNFGEPKFKATTKDEDGYVLSSGDASQEISMLAVTVGYSF